MSGNFGDIIEAFLSSPYFEGLSKATKSSWRVSLRLVVKTIGDIAADEIATPHLQAHLDGLTDFPGRQSVTRAVLSRLSKWAVNRGHLPHHIGLGLETIGSDGGHDPWTDEEIEAGIAHCRDDLGRAIALAINTGQRGSDIVRMRWSDLESKDGRTGISVTQQKTGVRLWIPLTHDFAAEIQTWEKRPPFYLILTKQGLPYARNYLTQHWQAERDTNPALALHKERNLHLHGLRASAVVRLRKLGFTTLEIASFIGMSEKMVSRYSRHADQAKMALATIERIENYRGAVQRTGKEHSQKKVNDNNV